MLTAKAKVIVGLTVLAIIVFISSVDTTIGEVGQIPVNNDMEISMIDLKDNTEKLKIEMADLTAGITQLYKEISLEIEKHNTVASILPENLHYTIPIIIQESEKNNLDPVYVLAVIDKESNFKPNAININTDGSRDMGLMQINEGTLPYLAKALGYSATQETAFDPVKNIKMGCYYLGEHNQRFNGDLYLTATAYNAGQRTALAGRNGYSESVVTLYNEYKELMQNQNN